MPFMPFVKLDTKILDSTLWIERYQREIFITALLMATPFESTEPLLQLETRSSKETGFVVPPGWYGLVRSSGVGIIHRALVEELEGYGALERLASPDPESQDPSWDGRRLVRVKGRVCGFIVLNYMKYREKDYTLAERQRRHREKRAAEMEALDESLRSVATQVLETVGIANGRLVPRIMKAIYVYMKEHKDWTPERTAKCMVNNYKQYLAEAENLRYIVTPEKFFTEGHWCNHQGWPIDKVKATTAQRAKVGMK